MPMARRADPTWRTALVAVIGIALAAAPRAQTDLDALMKRVLAHRDDNWKKLQQYVLDESQRVDVRGPSNLPLWGDRREYRWFIRDGYFVQSPLSVNGVDIGDDERRKYEDTYLKQAQARDRQRGRGRGDGAAVATPPAGADAAPGASPEVASIITQTRQPGFVNSAYFLRFKFESGTYAFVGHETLGGRDALRIEYYPTRLFSHEEDKQAREKRQGTDTRDQDVNAAMEQLFNKAALITLWVDPASDQIVKYTFDNVSLDFLPAAWLFRVTDAKAAMTMGQPIDGHPEVWLPRGIEMQFGVALAIGAATVRYQDDFHDYQQAKTSGRIGGGSRP